MTRKEKYIINFNAEKKRTIKTAHELYYGPEVIEALKAAKTDSELSRIMRSTREGLIGV